MQKINLAKLLSIGFVVLVILGLAGTTYYFYNQYRKLTKNPQLVSQQEGRDLTAKISKFMLLPVGEDPTLATVTDKDKLKEQPFFTKAENGDKVLIYTKERKAILYRPSINKVIEVAPLTIGAAGNQSGVQALPTQGQKVKVAIYNGSKTTGLSKEIEKKVVDIGGMEVVLKSNASKTDYSKTVVIDISGKMSDITSGMAQILGGEVSTLPVGEARPDADILIIAAR